MLEIKWVGGSEADRARIAEQHHNYLDANASFDWERLQSVFSGADHAAFFNLNGHVYNGRAPWTELWKFYKTRVQTGYWTPFDMQGVISGDLAVVWCYRKTHREWIGKEAAPNPADIGGRDNITRSTMVFEKKDGEWMVTHLHFSESKLGEPRPGGIE